jgi:hypothetical protein
MLEVVRRPQLRSAPLNCVHTTRTATRAVRCDRVMMSPARLQTAACACGRTSWPAAPGRAHHQSPVFPFLLPASCWWTARSLPVPFYCSTPASTHSQHKPTHPHPAAPSANSPSTKSRLRPRPARRSAPAAGAFSSDNSVSAVFLSFFPPEPEPFS